MGRFLEIFFDQFRSTSAITGDTNPAAMWMWLLLIVGVIGVIVAVERIVYLFRVGSLDAAKFMTPVMKNVEAGNIDKAFDICRRAKHVALPYVIMRGIYAVKSVERPDFRTIQDGVDVAMMELMPKLQSRISYVNLIGSISTLIGLAGTIFGLILAFDAVANAPEHLKAQQLASGISAAMSTTIAGLLIAIPMNVLYTFIINKITKIIDDIDEWSVKFVNLVQRVK